MHRFAVKANGIQQQCRNTHGDAGPINVQPAHAAVGLMEKVADFDDGSVLQSCNAQVNAFRVADTSIGMWRVNDAAVERLSEDWHQVHP